MPRYYFDVRNDGIFVPDMVGLEVDNLAAAVVEAAHVLAEMVDDIVNGALRQQLTIGIRGTLGEAPLKVALTLELTPHP
jgi:histidine ammonia-lyase